MFLEKIKERLISTEWREKFRQFFEKLMSDDDREHLIILRERLRLSQKNPGKYEAITSALFTMANFGLFPPHPHPVGPYPSISVAYHFFRMTDNITDKDSPLPDGFANCRDLIEQLKSQVRGELVDKDSDLGFLLHRTMRKLRRVLPEDEMRAELIDFLDAMRVENEKIENDSILSEAELATLYKNSFAPAHAVALAAFRSKTKKGELAELAQLQGRIYAVRDLKTELAVGNINIPKETIEICGLTRAELIADPKKTIENPAIQNWIQSELENGARFIENLRAKNLDRKAKLMVKFLTKSIEKYIQKNLVAPAGIEIGSKARF